MSGHPKYKNSKEMKKKRMVSRNHCLKNDLNATVGPDHKKKKHVSRNGFVLAGDGDLRLAGASRTNHNHVLRSDSE